MQGWYHRLCGLLLFLLATGLTRTQAQGQPYSTQNSKAIKYYESALDYLRNRDVGKARLNFEKALEKDTAFLEAHQRLAEIGRITGDDELMAVHYKKMAALRPNGPEMPSLYSFAARQAQNTGRYEEAEALYRKALASPNPLLPKLKSELEKGLASSRFAKDAVAHPISFTRKPLPPTVNRFPLQYTPTVTADDQIMVYTARKGVNPGFDEDIYLTKRDAQGNWMAPVSISDKINTGGNEGTSSLSADGRMMVFTSCDRSARGSCDIFYSKRTGDVWSEPVAIDSVNSDAWDSHPCLSADGNTLFFVSSRPGGYGRYDIYVSRRNRKGIWGYPRNVGPTINSADDEIMPFLHPNGKTLFFGSKGHPGMGGYDLFMADRAVEGTSSDWSHWKEPRNLGFPLNTEKDESSIFISPDGRRAYYCVEENRNGALIRSILYEFDLGDQLRMETRSFYVRGHVRDAATKAPLGSQVDLVDNASGKVLYSVESDAKTGEYLITLPEGNRYGLTVSAQGYLFQSRYFDFADAQSTGSVEQDFDLEALKKGAKTVLNNVFFASGSADLLPESQAELTRAATLFKTNPKLRVEIGGHTDSVGTDVANQALSRRRAEGVRSFLIGIGVPAANLQAIGFGESRPAAANRSEQGRALNRRIEFTIQAL